MSGWMKGFCGTISTYICDAEFDKETSVTWGVRIQEWF